jgi:hypothetical protein
MRRRALGLLLGAGLLLAAKAPSGQLAARVWTGLDATHNTCGGHDYGPTGGLRTVACHVASIISFDELKAASGTGVFVSGGPHDDGLDLDARDSFGFYDPKFVRWVGAEFVRTDPVAIAFAQPAYDQSLRPLARTHWAVWSKLQHEPACAKRLLADYETAMRGGDAMGFIEGLYYFQDPGFCGPDGLDEGGWAHRGLENGNVVKTVTAWWMRRKLDGTDELWAEQLHALLETHDADWLAKSAPVKIRH